MTERARFRQVFAEPQLLSVLGDQVARVPACSARSPWRRASRCWRRRSLAVTALRVTQGLGVLLAGVLAEVTAPDTAVAVSGAVGAVVALACARAWRTARGMTCSPQTPGYWLVSPETGRTSQ